MTPTGTKLVWKPANDCDYVYDDDSYAKWRCMTWYNQYEAKDNGIGHGRNRVAGWECNAFAF